MRLIAVALVFASISASAAAHSPGPYWQAQRCDHGYSSKAAQRGIAAILRTHSPLTKAEGRQVWKFSQCVPTRFTARLNIKYANALRRWRHSYEHRWPIQLNWLPLGWVQWARNITSCESGWNKYASNGTHFSYFQWASGTWAAASAGYDAPASPYDASWPHQAVIAIHWAWEAGTSQWTCSG